MKGPVIVMPTMVVLKWYNVKMVVYQGDLKTRFLKMGNFVNWMSGSGSFFELGDCNGKVFCSLLPGTVFRFATGSWKLNSYNTTGNFSLSHS